MEENAAYEGKADAQPGVLQCLDPLGVCRLVEGDVPVDCHGDDDKDRGDTEGIGQGPLEVSLPLEDKNLREKVSPGRMR